MIYQLQPNNFYKVEGLIKNTNHELSVNAVIKGTSPGEIYVDDLDRPLSMLIKTTECNVVAGKADNKPFNLDIREKLNFFDPITCDNSEWENHISEIHKNIALRKYTRRYYELDSLNFVDFWEKINHPFLLEYVRASQLDKLDYENSDDIRNWIQLTDIKSYEDQCLGSYIRVDDKIVSMSMIDCIVDNRVEIGVHTDQEFKRKGLASIVAAATVDACLSIGIKKIGWHCVDQNIGSRKTAEKVGFQLIQTYSSYTPYPPIENDSDLTKQEWAEWATYYSKMNSIQPYYHWQVAQCWAKAGEMEKTIENIKYLIRTKQKWFVEYLPEVDAFKTFEGTSQWQALLHMINESD